ncbi:MAG: aminopeptidase P family protein [Gemmatimonadota bacterium]|nr:MAG: aminopeptidase P family protein [Gemmatimonadota bacterium]
MRSPDNPAARRLARVRAGLAERQLDGLLVSHIPNLRYLTGFSGSSGWLLLDGERAILITDGRYETQAQQELPDDAGFELLVLHDKVLAGLADKAAHEFAGRRLGLEANHVAVDQWQRLRDDDGAVDWRSISGLVEEVRAQKDEGEIELVRKAAETAAAALADTLPLVQPGTREVDIAAELEYRMRRHGAEGAAFETIVASGERSALPHAATSECPIQEGDLLLIDFGARWRGYCSDLTRTFVVGQADARQREVYDLVLAAHEAACSALRVGALGSEVDAQARRSFEAAGLEERFPHSTGHGLGLEVHEGPRLGRHSEERLRPGTVVTVEPGLYFPGWGGIRIEDDLLVTAEGATALVMLEKGWLRSLPL